jgi:hypothetical protein
MSGGPADQAHKIVAALRTGGGVIPWRLDRFAVTDRLHELVADPTRLRQGGLNLCGPAALCKVWLERDPVAAVTYAVRLFECGRAQIGPLLVRPSRRLVRSEYGRTRRPVDCPQADWMMMAALRDASNRFLRYARQGGVREAAAAMTLPGALAGWLTATGEFTSVRDETNLVLRKGIGHATRLTPSPDRELFLLVALEMFRRAHSVLGKVRDLVVGQIPNHWVILGSPVEAGLRSVRFRFWSWGADHTVVLDRSTFDRYYYGCLVAESALRTRPSVS